MGVATHLGIRLREYDAQIRTFIPCYEEILDAAASALRLLGPRAPVVVDLGVGSGALAARCAEIVPHATIVGIDSDGGMLSLAKRRLGNRFAAVEGDFLTTTLPRSDAIVASFALHHVPTRRRKAVFYGRCFAALRPGGLLVNADCCLASNPQLDRFDRVAWLSHLQQRYTRTRAARFLDAWAKDDVYFRLEDEASLMRAAGFEVDVTWRRSCFAVIVATKSSTPASAASPSSARSRR